MLIVWYMCMKLYERIESLIEENNDYGIGNVPHNTCMLSLVILKRVFNVYSYLSDAPPLVVMGQVTPMEASCPTGVSLDVLGQHLL